MKPAEAQRAGSEAACLLNEAIRQLLIPQHLFTLFTKLEDSGRATERYGSAVRHVAIASAIINLYRLKETRDHFLVYLFSADELGRLGFPHLEQFVGNWKPFEIARHQYAGHAIAKRAKSGRPGRVLTAGQIGRALRRTGLWDAEAFLLRIREELVPAVEKVRNEIFRRFPEARRFVEITYPEELNRAAEGVGRKP